MINDDCFNFYRGIIHIGLDVKELQLYEAVTPDASCWTIPNLSLKERLERFLKIRQSWREKRLREDQITIESIK